LGYSVKEIFYSLQGEGFHSGRPAVFCRFAGCNLWSGKESDRAKAVCKFCDTDFRGTDGPGGGFFETSGQLAEAISLLWPTKESRAVRPFVVCTGGEPLLQLNAELIDAFHGKGFEVAVETNGTILPPAGVDWLCVSPKANTDWILRCGQELKLVFPQTGLDPAVFASCAFQYFFLQPCAGAAMERNTSLAVDYVLTHPQWRLSLQLHKILKIK